MAPSTRPQPKSSSSPHKTKEKAKAATKKHDVSWEERLKQLQEYKKEYGDCIVHRHFGKIPGLGNWVNNQRTKYKNNTLTSERLNCLKTIGFQFVVGQGVGGGRPKLKEGSWMKNYEELKKYKNEHGNCMVPQKYKQNPSLGFWAYCQRKKYRNNSLESDKLKSLEKIGFQFVVSQGVGGGGKLKEGLWMMRYEELLEYKGKFGNYDVPQSHGALRKWVCNQRHLKKNGKLCKERFRMLDKLRGFCWRGKTGRPSCKKDKSKGNKVFQRGEKEGVQMSGDRKSKSRKGKKEQKIGDRSRCIMKLGALSAGGNREQKRRKISKLNIQPSFSEFGQDHGDACVPSNNANGANRNVQGSETMGQNKATVVRLPCCQENIAESNNFNLSERSDGCGRDKEEPNKMKGNSVESDSQSGGIDDDFDGDSDDDSDADQEESHAKSSDCMNRMEWDDGGNGERSNNEPFQHFAQCGGVRFFDAPQSFCPFGNWVPFQPSNYYYGHHGPYSVSGQLPNCFPLQQPSINMDTQSLGMQNLLCNPLFPWQGNPLGRGGLPPVVSRVGEQGYAVMPIEIEDSDDEGEIQCKSITIPKVFSDNEATKMTGMDGMETRKETELGKTGAKEEAFSHQQFQKSTSGSVSQSTHYSNLKTGYDRSEFDTLKLKLDTVQKSLQELKASHEALQLADAAKNAELEALRAVVKMQAPQNNHEIQPYRRGHHKEEACEILASKLGIFENRLTNMEQTGFLCVKSFGHKIDKVKRNHQMLREQTAKGFDTFNRRVAALHEKQQTTDEDVTTLYENQKASEEEVATLHEKQQMTDENVTTIYKNQKKSEEEVATLHDNLRKVERAQNKVRRRADFLETESKVSKVNQTQHAAESRRRAAARTPHSSLEMLSGKAGESNYQVEKQISHKKRKGSEKC